MNKDLFKELGLFGKLLMLILVILFFSIIGLALVTLLFGTSTDINLLKLNQLLLSIFTLVIPPIVCGYYWYNKPIEAFHLNKIPNAQIIFLTILLFFLVSPFINLLSYINEQMVLPDFLSAFEDKFREMEDNAAELTEKLLYVNSIGGLLFNILVIAIMPALGEELLFRGAILNIFSDKIKNIHVVVWVVAAIFSLIHFQMYGFLPRMVLGAVLGYLLIWSGSLWLPIIAHFTNNAIATVVSYIGQNNEQVKALEELGKAETIWYGVISFILSGIVLWMIYKQVSKEKFN